MVSEDLNVDSPRVGNNISYENGGFTVKYLIMSLMVSSISMASMKKGDSVTYLVQDSIHGTTWSQNMTLEVTSISPDNSYSMELKSSAQNSQNVITLDVPGWSADKTEKDMQKLLSHCDENGGTQSLFTIHGQNINTCIIKKNYGTSAVEFEYGDIPFYQVRQTQREQNGDISVKILTDFKK